MKHFNYVAPATIAEASQALKGGNSVLSAGGSDLLGVLKGKLLPTYPDKVVSLKDIDELKFIHEEDDGLHIGAMTTLAEIIADASIKDKWSAIVDAAYSVATPNILNRATIGGNICQDIRCWYYRYPHSIGERVDCARKEGHLCYAMMGENRYHSIFGAGKVCETPCTMSCPGHTDISAYMEMFRHGDIDGAARVILEANPMPAITGRVCAHFCMEDCNRQTYDESVNINSVEHYIGDYILDHYKDFMIAPKEENGKNVAIIGSGPAGLAAAYYLRQNGYNVTIYEKQNEAGGCFTYAIPAYRLSKEIVKKFICALEEMGVVFKFNTHVGKDITLDYLRENNDALFIGVGTWTSLSLGCEGEDVKGVVGGIEFLSNSMMNENMILGEKVAIVGGGNTAMDAARTAKRLGAKEVYVLYRRTRAEMPAQDIEITEAEEEGIILKYLVSPKEIISENGSTKQIRLQKMELGEPDQSGRRRPVPIKGEEEVLDVDLIVGAIGQTANLDFLNGSNKVDNDRNCIIVNECNKTSVPGIYAGGDVVTGPATVIAAVAAGKNAAISINEYCGENELYVQKVEKERKKNHLLTFNNQCHKFNAAVKDPILPVEKRSLDKEDVATLTLDEVKQETNRCFNCGCLAVNPSDMANVLLTYGAFIKTNYRTMSAEKFLTSHTKASDVLRKGEIVMEIIIPKVSEHTVVKYNKYRARKSIDFAILAVASMYTIEEGIIKDARITLGAVAPVPLRATKAEQYLIGKKIDEEVAIKAAELALEGAIPLKNNAYKINMAKTMIRRSFAF